MNVQALVDAYEAVSKATAHRDQVVRSQFLGTEVKWTHKGVTFKGKVIDTMTGTRLKVQLTEPTVGGNPFTILAKRILQEIPEAKLGQSKGDSDDR